MPTLALGKAEERITARESWLSRWSAWWGHVTAIIEIWMRRSRSRRRLAELDDHELGDIALSRQQARFESEKPFWRP